MKYKKVYNKISVGMTLEYFTIVSEAPLGVRGQRRWFCECSCGEFRTVEDKNLKNRNTVSCGCHKQALAKALGEAALRHGESCSKDYTPEYRTWQSLMGRCNTLTNPKFPRYGGRGIKVCERWLRYESFLADMGRKPSLKHTIEREDNNGDYCPENCRWATATEQARNKSNNLLITYEGTTRCLAEWAELLGMQYKTLWMRLKSGWSIQRTLTTPILTKSRLKEQLAQ